MVPATPNPGEKVGSQEKSSTLPGVGRPSGDLNPSKPQTSPSQPSHTRFFMSAELDNTRINRDVQRLVEEIINHLINAEGCKVEVTLEVNAVAPDGLSASIVRTVMENCKTLKIKTFGVED